MSLMAQLWPAVGPASTQLDLAVIWYGAAPPWLLQHPHQTLPYLYKYLAEWPLTNTMVFHLLLIRLKSSNKYSTSDNIMVLDKVDLAVVQRYDKGLIDVHLFLHLPTSLLYTFFHLRRRCQILQSFFNQSSFSSISLNHSVHYCEND